MKNKLKFLLISSSLLILPGISSIHFINDYFTNSSTSYIAKTDNSRLGSNYYGLDWGSKTDELIESKIDTGDLVFYYKYNSILKKLFFKMNLIKKIDNNNKNCYNGMAMAVRTTSNLMIIEYVKGRIKLKSYSEFLSDNSILAIKIRFKKINKIIKSDSSTNNNSNINLLTNIKQGRYYNSADMINDYLIKSDYCSSKDFDLNKYIKNKNIEDLNNYISSKAFPLCLKPKDKIDYSSYIIVRSNSSV